MWTYRNICNHCSVPFANICHSSVHGKENKYPAATRSNDLSMNWDAPKLEMLLFPYSSRRLSFHQHETCSKDLNICWCLRGNTGNCIATVICMDFWTLPWMWITSMRRWGSCPTQKTWRHQSLPLFPWALHVASSSLENVWWFWLVIFFLPILYLLLSVSVYPLPLCHTHVERTSVCEKKYSVCVIREQQVGMNSIRKLFSRLLHLGWKQSVFRVMFLFPLLI